MKRRAGVKYAKTHLSAMLRDVKEGHEWIISERGKPVARLTPAKREIEPLDVWLARMEAEGHIKRGRGKPGKLPLPIRLDPPDLAQRMLDEDRSDDHIGR